MNKPYIPKIGEMGRIIDVWEDSAGYGRRDELIGQIVKCETRAELNPDNKNYIVLAWKGKIGSFSSAIRVAPLNKSRQSKLIEE